MSARVRVASGVAALANCLTAGAPFTFPLWAPTLERTLHLSSSQLNIVASAAILGEYASAAGFGALADRRGPGAVSFAAAVLFGVGFGGLAWRYQRGAEWNGAGGQPWEYEWAALSLAWFICGCATAASYFGAITSLTKSAPSSHSGLAIGVPCAVFGLSPLFLSAIASFFTTHTATGETLDVAKYLSFLGALLLAVNFIGGFLIKELPWEDNLDKVIVDAIEPFDDDEARVDEPDSGFATSPPRSVADEANERTSLLGKPAVNVDPTTSSQPFTAVLASPCFWLLGGVVFLSTGPAEMYMASIGQVLDTLVSNSVAAGATTQSALTLAKRHIALLSITNTAWRLVVGAASDYLAAPSDKQAPVSAWRRHVRLVFVGAACALLVAAYGWGGTGLSTPSGLWIITLLTACSYGTVFTLTPTLIRSRWAVVDFGRNWGAATLFSAAGALLFTPLFGILRDLASRKDGDGPRCVGPRCYRPIFALSAVSALLATALVAVLAQRWRKRL
ncbi:putative transporter MCH1 [Rhodotorula toruloides]|nr:putative transporter MCH1 [Rhodotorula toruloides]PRQ77818.1 putative MFS monocarboxylic acid transporter [Rhodotorula toruloides]